MAGGENTKDLFSLAVKCRLITYEQQGRLERLYGEKLLTGDTCSAADLFRETQILSDEDIDFLYAVRQHLKMKMLDKRFGELGIANQLVRPESVQEALDLQSAIFKETKESRQLGDILLEKKQISRADKTAILLTQDRIEDDFLAEAMNDIATSEIERISVNMRFGAIAVKKGLITLEQLNAALKIQEEESEAGGERRYLGEIIAELFGLSPEDLKHILKIQKEFEKKRLSLEAALSRYYSESNTGKRLSKIFTYHFSKNKLAAHVRKTSDSAAPVGIPEFISWLHSIGITSGIVPEAEIASFLEQGVKGSQVCIARGTPPQKGKNETIEFFFDTVPKPADATEAALPMVRQGDVLAKITPPEEGIPGEDVCGFAVSPPKPRLIPINGGQGVTRKNGVFISEIDGVASLYKKRTLFVQPRTRTVPVRHYTGAVDSDLSDTFQDAILKVDGSILSKGRVRCRRLEVSENLLGHVFSAGEIHVRGDIGDEQSNKDQPAKLTADGDIYGGKKIINAVLTTAKGVKAPSGDLISCRVTAFEDVVMKNILSGKGGPCVLQVGTHSGLSETPFDDAIEERQTELENLMQKDALDELDRQFNAKISAKDAYLAQHQALAYFQALLVCESLRPVKSLQAKLGTVRDDPSAFPDLPPLPQEPLKAAAGFLPGFFKETAEMPPGDQESHIRELSDIKYGMYRAAVNASRRHHREYQRRKKEILEKTLRLKPEIQTLESRIRSLKSQRDGYLLRRETRPMAAAPAVMVKNRVQQGTMIMGRHAVLTVERDIYGVKFTETRKSKSDPYEILIEGLYE